MQAPTIKVTVLPPGGVHKEVVNSVLSRVTPQAEEDISADFDLLEALPPGIRYKVRELSQKMSCEAATRVFDLQGYNFTLFAIDKQESIEIRRFAKQYFNETGQEYPFIAAGARIQRYSNGAIRTRRRTRMMRFEDEAGIMKVPASPRWRRRRH